MLYKEVKQITINFGYSSFFNKSKNLTRRILKFTKNKVTFIRKAVGVPTKECPNIEISYNPFAENDIDTPIHNYEDDYKDMSCLVRTLKSRDLKVMDFEPTEIEVIFLDGTKDIIKGLINLDKSQQVVFDEFIEIAIKYLPKLTDVSNLLD